jgi:hypothetical protein
MVPGIPTADQQDWSSHGAVSQLVAQVASHLGATDVHVHVMLDARFPAHALAGFFRLDDTGVIVIQRKSWPFLPNDKKWLVVVHEACHLVDAYLPGDQDADPHGPRWIALMERCGADPLVVFRHDHLWTEARVRAVFPRRKWLLKCTSCTYAWGLTTAFAERTLRYGAGNCPVCSEPLYVRPIDDKVG